MTASEEVAPSTGTSVPEEQTAETSSAVAEAAPQATTPAEKQEIQASIQDESVVEATTTPVEEKSNRNNCNKFRRSKRSIIK